MSCRSTVAPLEATAGLLAGTALSRAAIEGPHDPTVPRLPRRPVAGIRDRAHGTDGDLRRVLQRDARPLLHEQPAGGHRRPRFRPPSRLGADGAGVRRHRCGRPGTQSCLPVLHPAGQGRFALLLGCAGRVPGGAGQNGKRSQLRRLLLRKPRCLVHGAARSADRHLPCRHRAGVAPVERARRLQPPLHGQLGGARPDACAGPHARRLRPVRGGHVRTGAGTDRDAGRCIRAIPVHRRLRRRRVVRHRLCRRGGRADARGESDQSGQPRRCLAAGPLVERQRTGPRHRRLAGRRAHLDAGRGRVLPLHRRRRDQRRRLRPRERSVGDLRAGRHRLADRARDRPARRARCWSAARPTAAGPGAPRRR